MIDPDITNEVDELLTAYLDKELSESERIDLQNRLMDEPQLRQRLAELQKAWDLLDDLPETPTSQEFTKSTLELVAVGMEKGWEDPASTQTFAKRFSGWRLIAILLTLGIGIGLLGGAISRIRSQNEELEQLNAIAYLPGLKAIDSIQDLQGIADVEDLLFVARTPEVFDERMVTGLPMELNRRVEWIRELSSSQQSILWGHDQQWKRLTPEDRIGYSKLADEVAHHSDRETLLLTLSILSSMYEDRGNEILLLKANNDVSRRDRLRHAFYRKLGEYYFHNMEKSDSEFLRDWFRPIFADPTSGLARAFSYSGNMRKGALRQSLLELPPETIRHLMTTVAVENGEPQPGLTARARRILEGVDSTDQAILLAESIEDIWLRDLEFETISEVYQRWDQDTRDEFDLRTFTDLKNQIRRELRNRPSLGGGTSGNRSSSDRGSSERNP